MTKFLFKSDKPDFQKLSNQLDTVLAEQRHARVDLAYIIRILNAKTHDKALQQQVDEYFDDDVTSPQTEPGEQT